MVLFPCFHNGLGPFGTVYCVRIILSLQANTAALCIQHTFFTQVSSQEIAGIELDTGAVGDHAHGAAGYRIGQDCAGIAEYLKVMVITALQVQCLIVFPNITANIIPIIFKINNIICSILSILLFF